MRQIVSSLDCASLHPGYGSGHAPTENRCCTVEPWGARFAQGSAAVLDEPVHRSCHSAGAVFRAAVAGTYHRAPPREAGQRELRAARRQITIAGTDRGTGARAGVSLAGARCTLLRRHALLASVQ